MPLHCLVVAKVKLLGLSNCHTFTATPILASLMWPFCFKVLLSLRPIKDIFETMAQDSSLFVFQLSRIIMSQATGRRRWQRILRLAQERMAMARQSVALATYDDSLHTLSMVAL
ncbi:hypothetical protein L2E82_06817 [Cichorium intybus]|uniref:Uncharacterized protein n=1 Tax=Cichorium intybus TaxID=13427 RepID=A0ACB9HAL1_CICIN|nr:hypothetical protein L2E82_06817 [Cichorium intybus]